MYLCWILYNLKNSGNRLRRSSSTSFVPVMHFTELGNSICQVLVRESSISFCSLCMTKMLSQRRTIYHYRQVLSQSDLVLIMYWLLLVSNKKLVGVWERFHSRLAFNVHLLFIQVVPSHCARLWSMAPISTKCMWTSIQASNWRVTMSLSFNRYCPFVTTDHWLLDI